MSAIDALRAATRRGEYTIPVACATCGWGRGLLLVHLDVDGEQYVDLQTEAGETVVECPGCLEQLALDDVVERQAVIA